VPAAVPQNHQARLRLPVSSAAVLRRPPLSHCTYARCAQNPLNRSPRNLNLLDLSKLLPKVVVVETDILRAHQLHDSLARLLVEAIHRVPANQAVHHALSSTRLDGISDSPNLPIRQAQQQPSLDHRQRRTLDSPHCIQPLPLLLAHLVHASA
jgi:hypothetical protein